MKVKLDTVLYGTDEKPLTNEKGTPLTVRLAITNGLLSDLDKNHAPIRGDEKIKRYDVWLKVKATKDSPEIELTPEEASLIREAVLLFPTLVAGQVREALA